MRQDQRYNIFKKTHKGLRSMLFDAGARIQQTDFTKAKQADAAIEVVKQTTRSFLYHLSKEDSILYHSVVLYAPYIVAMIEQTNAKDEKLAKEVDKVIEGQGSLFRRGTVTQPFLSDWTTVSVPSEWLAI